METNTSGLLIPGAYNPTEVNAFYDAQGRLTSLSSIMDSVQLVKGMTLPRRRLSCAAGNVPFKNTGNGPSQNATYCMAISAWGSFNAVQLIYVNGSSSAASVVDATVVGVGSTLYPSGVNNCVNADGGYSAAQASQSTSAGVSQDQPAISLGSVIPIQSVARSTVDAQHDGGIYPLLFIRGFVQTGNTNANYDTMPTNWTTIYNSSNNLGFSMQAHIGYSVNGVATTGNIVSGACDSAPVFVVGGAIFTYDQAMTSVCNIGDSTNAGNNDGATGILGATFQATAAIRNSGKMCSHFNAGVSGATMPQITANVATIMTQASARPDVVLIHSWTVNSVFSTQAQWDTQWQLVMQQANQIASVGSIPIIVTPWPNSGITTGEVASRTLQRTRVMNCGYPYVDVESMAVSSTGNWAYASDTVDGTHATYIGNQKMSVLYQPAINAAIANF